MQGPMIVDELMKPVDDIIREHVPWKSDAFREIHNKAWGLVYEIVMAVGEDELRVALKKREE